MDGKEVLVKVKEVVDRVRERKKMEMKRNVF